jgi:hypothetical protein
MITTAILTWSQPFGPFAGQQEPICRFAYISMMLLAFFSHVASIISEQLLGAICLFTPRLQHMFGNGLGLPS